MNKLNRNKAVLNELLLAKLNSNENLVEQLEESKASRLNRNFSDTRDKLKRERKETFND